MTKPRQAEPHPGSDGAGAADPRKATFAPSSGIVRREDLDDEAAGGAPPWAIVHAYLTRGEHSDRVEAHAQRSRAFAEVLEALRNDHEARQESRGRLLPFRRGTSGK